MRWQGALALTAAVAVGEGRAALAADTQRVIAGRPQYDRSGYFKWHFGEGYRKLWTAPFEAPVLDLKSYAGGLTPVRKVGSMQSIGLALKAPTARPTPSAPWTRTPPRSFRRPGGIRSRRPSSRTRRQPAIRVARS